MTTDLMMTSDVWLPLVFAGLMGISILIYVILDGYDLGVGVLLPLADDTEKDSMIASIGPFWDANETWLVLAVGILLVAFPVAHGTILMALYLPVTLMLIGLALRGVAFEFRAKAPANRKTLWNRIFFIGSAVTTLCQGFMLGMYIMGLEYSYTSVFFSITTAIILSIAYSFIGATWLILKTENQLQSKAIQWAKGGIWGVIAGMVSISIATPLASERIWEKWFSFPELILLMPLPMMFSIVALALVLSLRKMPFKDDKYAWLPFVSTVILFFLSFIGLAYSFYPYVVPDKITIYEAASSPESLIIILVGTLFVLPVIIGYSCLSYYIFRGKAKSLSYK